MFKNAFSLVPYDAMMSWAVRVAAKSICAFADRFKPNSKAATQSEREAVEKADRIMDSGSRL